MHSLAIVPLGHYCKLYFYNNWFGDENPKLLAIKWYVRRKCKRTKFQQLFPQRGRCQSSFNICVLLFKYAFNVELCFTKLGNIMDVYINLKSKNPPKLCGKCSDELLVPRSSMGYQNDELGMRNVRTERKVWFWLKLAKLLAIFGLGLVHPQDASKKLLFREIETQHQNNCQGIYVG